MKLSTIRDLLEDQLKDLHNAESQLVKAFPKVAARVSSDELKAHLELHLTETEHHISRLEQIARVMECKLSGKTCAAMQGLIREASEALDAGGDDGILDLAAIAAARRIEHYELSAYSSARLLADALCEMEVVRLLDETLKEEEQAERSLKVLSEDIIDSCSPCDESVGECSSRHPSM